MTDTQRPAWAAYQSRADLEEFKPNALLVFAAELRLGLDDLSTFAANALTDGSNDKKCDMVAVHRETRRLVIAQGYETDRDIAEAPAGKASDLNTAVTWVLSGDLNKMPQLLRGAVLEARSAVANGEISELQIWYVHNLPESRNVEDELYQAARTADSLLNREFPDIHVDVSHIEIGRNSLEQEYRRTKVPILVTEKIRLEVPGGFESAGDRWMAYSTSVSASDLRDLWRKHEAKLMSPNIRDYLGVVQKQENINHGIKVTATTEPTNLAIFNNGITVLVNDYEVLSQDANTHLEVSGFGIVNGGQTTGSLGTLNDADAESITNARIMARFVKCSDEEVLTSIVRFNNTQNRIEATDFRSKDAVQERLRREFESIPDAEYKGGRRGGSSDAIPRSRMLLSDKTVAQALAAFHGDPNLAYNDTRKIWVSDGAYSEVFRDEVSARHIVLVVGLLRAIEEAKLALSRIVDGKRTAQQNKHAEFLSGRGSNFLMLAAIGGSIETIIDCAVPNRYKLHFEKNLSPVDATSAWSNVVASLLPHTSRLAGATNQGLKSREKVDSAISDFADMVEATRSANDLPFASIAAEIK